MFFGRAFAAMASAMAGQPASMASRRCAEPYCAVHVRPELISHLVSSGGIALPNGTKAPTRWTSRTAGLRRSALKDRAGLRLGHD